MSANELKNEKQYLSVEQQIKLSQKLLKLAEHEPLWNKLFFSYSSTVAAIPLYSVFLLSWRAGFRGYGLSRYGKSRFVSIVTGLIFPTNGVMCHECFASCSFTEPFRPENPWSYGWRFAAWHQVGLLASLYGGFALTFLFARGSGVLVVPQDIIRGGWRSYTGRLFFGRIKPYSKNLAIAGLCSTAFMFLAGAAGYLQSKKLLAKMGRQSLVFKED